MTTQSLQDHMQEHIGISIADPVIDGRWHSGRGKLGKVSYVGLYLAKGVLVRYRTHAHGQGDTCHVWREWEGTDQHFDADEWKQRKAEAQAKLEAAAKAEQAEREHLLTILQTIIRESVPASHGHSYPSGKRILALAARQAIKSYQITPATTDTKAQYINPDDLLIPVYSHTGQLQGIQQITLSSLKLTRGMVKDGLLWIGGGLTTGEVANRLYIAEGWATAVAVHTRTRNPVVVAFSTANLLSVGQWARARYPDAEIVYAVDNDLGSFITVDGQPVENPGKYYATQAAIAINAAVITPPLEGKADWCDWHAGQVEANKKARPAATESSFQIQHTR